MTPEIGRHPIVVEQGVVYVEEEDDLVLCHRCSLLFPKYLNMTGLWQARTMIPNIVLPLTAEVSQSIVSVS
jgi:hypothetical protein